MSAVHHAFLGVSVAALVGAGLRVAGAVGARGLERAIASAAIAASLAVTEAMLLGLVKLGSDPYALTGAAVLTWLAARAWVAGSQPGPARELRAWLREAPATVVVLVSCAAALALTWTLWTLRTPFIGIDAIYYHLPQAMEWVHTGTPGTVDYIHYWLWVGDYPLVNGVLQAWGMGISRGLPVTGVWPVVAIVLVGVSAWVLLEAFEIEPWLRGLAILALVSPPVVLIGLVGPLNDLPALAWLLCAAALLVRAREVPGLAVPGVLAAGLAAGTKTTALPLALITVAVGLWPIRYSLRPLRGALLAAAGLAILVGGFWYARALVRHGSPFWPWGPAPWGDPMPEVLERYGSLLEHPRATLEGRLDAYAAFVGGAAVLLAAGAVLPLLASAWRVRAIGAGVAALLLLWASAPSTAKTTGPVFDGSVSQLRYLLPTIALGVVGIALVGAQGGWRRVTAIATLAAASAWSLGQLLTGVFPVAPSNATLLTGAALGLAGGAILAWPVRGRLPVPAGIGAGAAAVALAVLMAIPASGWVRRHGEEGGNFDSELAVWFSDQPAFTEGDEPVHMAPLLASTLAGDGIDHDLSLIRADLPCHRLRRLGRDGWIVIKPYPVLRREIGYTVGNCDLGRRPLATVGGFRIYPPLGS